MRIIYVIIRFNNNRYPDINNNPTYNITVKQLYNERDNGII